jgi:hypothetical protein
MEGIAEGPISQGGLLDAPFLFDPSEASRPALSFGHRLRTGRSVVDFNGVVIAGSWGNRRWNVVPTPGALSTQIFPLCASTTSFTILVRSPVPPFPLVVHRSVSRFTRHDLWPSGAV